MMDTVTTVYEVPRWINGFLFLGVILLEAPAVVLLWRAVLRYRRYDAAGLALLYPPVLLLAVVWAGFILADEFFLVFVTPLVGVMAAHVRSFTLLLASFLLLRLVPGATHPNTLTITQHPKRSLSPGTPGAEHMPRPGHPAGPLVRAALPPRQTSLDLSTCGIMTQKGEQL